VSYGEELTSWTSDRQHLPLACVGYLGHPYEK
jgi:hypothetical protein